MDETLLGSLADSQIVALVAGFIIYIVVQITKKVWGWKPGWDKWKKIGTAFLIAAIPSIAHALATDMMTVSFVIATILNSWAYATAIHAVAKKG